MLTELDPNPPCKPCPSCKSNDVSLNSWTNNSLQQGCFIRCYTCQTCGPTAETLASAYEKWNDMPRLCQEDVIELPKDAEDIPVRPGDVLYGGENEYLTYLVDEIIYKADDGWAFNFIDGNGFKGTRNPECFSHHPQTPLDEIKREVYYLAKKSGLKQPQTVTADIIMRIKKLTEESK